MDAVTQKEFPYARDANSPYGIGHKSYDIEFPEQVDTSQINLSEASVNARDADFQYLDLAVSGNRRFLNELHRLVDVHGLGSGVTWILTTDHVTPVSTAHIVCTPEVAEYIQTLGLGISVWDDQPSEISDFSDMIVERRDGE